MKTTPKLPLVSHQFTYQDKPLRMLQDTCETWFVAADICTALGLPQVSRAVRRIDPAYRKLMKVSLLSQPRRRAMMNVVSPAGLEQLTLLADKHPARSLRRWLRREVAPVQQWCKDDPYAAAGLPELITYDLQAYQDKAVELATTPGACLRLREHLEMERANGVLFDTPRFVRNLERELANLVAAPPLLSPDAV